MKLVCGLFDGDGQRLATRRTPPPRSHGRASSMGSQGNDVKANALRQARSVPSISVTLPSSIGTVAARFVPRAECNSVIKPHLTGSVHKSRPNPFSLPGSPSGQAAADPFASHQATTCQRCQTDAQPRHHATPMGILLRASDSSPAHGRARWGGGKACVRSTSQILRGRRKKSVAVHRVGKYSPSRRTELLACVGVDGGFETPDLALLQEVGRGGAIGDWRRAEGSSPPGPGQIWFSLTARVGRNDRCEYAQHLCVWARAGAYADGVTWGRDARCKSICGRYVRRASM